MNPDQLHFAASHEWVSDGNPATVGISHFAQDQLGDVVFVELPKVGTALAAGDPFGSVESVKTVSDVYAPITGRVAAVNEALVSTPELVNSSPYDEGWLIKIESTGDLAAELGALQDRATYESTAAH
ncbi:MAG TPA: glycine cleavage system protein GcvH [Chloroflexota bacterium]|nr:glycine cleavage system protein GcvH [Chloroflexota bacterium]